nr:YfhO family protein [Myxococcota bacterium]
VLRGALWSVDPTNTLDLMYPTGGGTGVLRGTIVLRGSGPARPDLGPPLPCTIGRWEAGAIDVACTTDADGYAAISSASAPGWTATVDGRETGWLTADVLRRAVPITAGTHTIAWRYRAPGLTFGLLAAVIAALGLLAMVVAARRARA